MTCLPLFDVYDSVFTDSSVCNFLSSCYEESYLNAPRSRPSHGRSSRYSCIYVRYSIGARRDGRRSH